MNDSPGRRVPWLAAGIALSLGLAGALAVVLSPAPAPVLPQVAAAKAAPQVVPPRASAAPASKPSRTPAEKMAAPIVIAAGGDVNFGRECGQAILADPTYDPFRFVAPLWRDADVRFVNLESQLSDQKGETQSPRNRLIFTGPPGGGRTLAGAGVQIASTANNHAWDYGKRAMLETLDNLAQAGVKSVGTGRTLADAYEPAVVTVRGQSVAVFAVTQIWNAGDIETHEGRHHVAWTRANRLRALLKKARREHAVVLLSYHGGAEYIDAPVGPTRRFLEPLIKAGLVDAVIGHHPHVPQGIGWYAGRPVFYSLGNFVFAGHDWAPWTKKGFLARLEIEPGRSLRAFACPYALDGHVPKPIPPSDPASEAVREHIVLTSTAVGGTRASPADERGCFELLPPLPADVRAAKR